MHTNTTTKRHTMGSEQAVPSVETTIFWGLLQSNVFREGAYQGGIATAIPHGCDDHVRQDYGTASVYTRYSGATTDRRLHSPDHKAKSRV